LARFVAMIVAAGVGLGGGMHWRESARALSQAKAEYQAALVRYWDADEGEKPAHEVSLTEPFHMGKYEITQEQYELVMGTNRSTLTGHDLPVGAASWDDAQEFCRNASEWTGLAVRLPTEAEWEYACRAGTRTTYYTGDAYEDLDRAAWYVENSNGTIHPVGKKVPNAWGVHDMHGNVSEWVLDCWGPYRSEAAVDPQGPAQGTQRVKRGGSWAPGRWRSASRFADYPGHHFNGIGFRVVADVPPKAP